jgi:hypothetical protein
MTQPPFSGPGLAQGVSGRDSGRGPQPPWPQAGPPPASLASYSGHHAAVREPEVAYAAPMAASQATAAAMPVTSTSRRRAQRQSGTGVVYSLLLLCTVAAMGLVWSSPRDVRWGADLFGAGLLLSAVARVVLPARSAGMLATRQRWTDAVTLTVLGLGTLAVGLVLPPPT